MARPNFPDSILMVAGALRVTKARATMAFNHWKAANERFTMLFSLPGTTPDGPSESNIESAMLDAVSAYEAMLDQKRLQWQLELHLAGLKNRRRIQWGKRPPSPPSDEAPPLPPTPPIHPF